LLLVLLLFLLLLLLLLLVSIFGLPAPFSRRAASGESSRFRCSKARRGPGRW
jgi:hypothetical protein